MDHLADIFSGDAFSVRTLTDAFNIVPNQYGRVNALGLFKEEGVDSNLIALEFDNGVLNIIPTSKTGTAPPKNKTGKRTEKPLSIPRYALDDLILPKDIQNVRAFGSTNLLTPEKVVNDRLVALSKKHDQTDEYRKCGAISGIIKDADGTTLLNLFTEFNVTEKVVNFALSTDATKVASKVREVVGHIEDNLKGETYDYIHALCSPEFFDLLVSHPKVTEAYQFAMSQQAAVLNYGGANANPLRNDVRRGFVWQGVYWEEYRGAVTRLNADGTTTTIKLIETDYCRFVPVGTNDTFRSYNAPADWMETVNTIGQKKYAKVVPETGGRWVEVLSQGWNLPICIRPAVLVKGQKA